MADAYALAVVVLAYNQRAYLPACLASLAAQDLAQVQIILADDASQDGSAAWMAQWAQGRPNVQTLLLAENQGHCRAFNRALQLVEAPFVIDLAADDVLPPQSLHLRAQALQARPDAAFCHGNALYIDEAGRPLGLEHPADTADAAWQGYVWQRLFEGRFICPSTVMFRTEALRAAGGYNPLLTFEDFDIWMRLARHAPVAYVPAVVSHHRLHPASASAAQVGRRAAATLASVCHIGQTAFNLAQTPAERKAVARFLAYHVRMAAYTGNPQAVRRLQALLRQEGFCPSHQIIWQALAHLPLSPLYARYTARKRKQQLYPVPDLSYP